MSLYNRNWLPPWPVVPSRLWLTAAATVMVGLSIVFRMEIWPHHPKAHLGSWIVLGLLMQAGGIQVIRMLRVWLREYRGPIWVRLLMWGTVLPVYGAVVLLIVGFILFTCFSLGSVAMD
ncbi:hypothetical protein ACVWYF_001990 [Hymenobacter sp. UYAg731]